MLPASLFESRLTLETGLLNQAAPNPGPHPDWDPDIVAALDDDFNFDDLDNVLEDDFIQVANAGGELEENIPEEDEEEQEEDEDVGSEKEDAFDDEEMFSYAGEETKSRFTNYSLTSSVIRRSKGLRNLDDQFEKVISWSQIARIKPLLMES